VGGQNRLFTQEDESKLNVMGDDLGYGALARQRAAAELVHQVIRPSPITCLAEMKFNYISVRSPRTLCLRLL